MSVRLGLGEFLANDRDDLLNRGGLVNDVTRLGYFMAGSYDFVLVVLADPVLCFRKDFTWVLEILIGLYFLLF